MTQSIAEDDWRTAVELTAGLSTMTIDEELASQIQDIQWVKLQGAWVVERLSFKTWLQNQLIDPSTINTVLRQLIDKKLIGAPRVTSQKGKTFRTHTLFARNLADATVELDAN